MAAALWPPRAATRRAYARVLAQRNALLARIRSGARLACDARRWDRELARHALALRDDREPRCERCCASRSRSAPPSSA